MLQLPNFDDDDASKREPRPVWHLRVGRGARVFVALPVWWRRPYYWLRGYRCTHHYWLTKPSHQLRQDLLRLTGKGTRGRGPQ